MDFFGPTNHLLVFGLVEHSNEFQRPVWFDGKFGESLRWTTGFVEATDLSDLFSLIDEDRCEAEWERPVLE